MRLYLRQSFKDKLVIPKALLNKEFLPMGAPLLDFLTVETEGPTGWKYPKLEDLREYQSNRGLTFSVLEEVEVREIICGISTQDEIEKFHEWVTEKHIENQDKFDTGVMSVDGEDVKASYYDIMRMAGEIVIANPGIQVFKSRIDDRAVPGIREDGWKQTPGKIMFGDGLTWTGIISLPYKRDKDGNYLISRITVQPRLLEVLKDLPVCTGVGVRRDVVGIEEFYSILSGETVELNGFLDLSAMAAAAGYKLRARNMTAMGVQILGTVLNKTVSTGDDSWGIPWNELPRSLQVYGIGDIRFGFICYNVLAGIIARDLFPEPEIVCKILKTEQRGAISWVLEWIIKSLEGVELHQQADKDATTRRELLSALRFGNSRNKVDISPPLTLSYGQN